MVIYRPVHPTDGELAKVSKTLLSNVPASSLLLGSRSWQQHRVFCFRAETPEVEVLAAGELECHRSEGCPLVQG